MFISGINAVIAVMKKRLFCFMVNTLQVLFDLQNSVLFFQRAKSKKSQALERTMLNSQLL